MSERTSEWPSTYVSILVCSRPQCLVTRPSFGQRHHCHPVITLSWSASPNNDTFSTFHTSPSHQSVMVGVKKLPQCRHYHPAITQSSARHGRHHQTASPPSSSQSSFAFHRVHYGIKPGHFETLKIHFPTSEGVSEVSERANE